MFSFLKSDRLAPDWTFPADGVIWRMMLAGRERLIGECRDPEKRVASFFCLDMATGKVVWEDLRLDEPWWVGIEAVQDDVILLHKFAKPDMPEHKGVWAYDVISGVQLWRNDDVAYWFVHDDRVIASRDFFERRVGYEIDLRTGSVLKTHDGSLEALHELRLHATEDQTASEVTLPEVFNESEADETLAALIKKETKGRELSGRIEYIRQNDVLIFNVHVQSRENAGGTKLENNLVIYRLPEKKRVFADVIGRNLTG